MSERYLIAGTQLGCILSVGRHERETLINEIIDEQFLGNSDKPIKEDVKRLEGLF